MFACAALALTACGKDSSSSSSDQKPENVFDSEFDLPECSDDLGFNTAYIGEDSVVYVCVDGEWTWNVDLLSSSSRRSWELSSSSAFERYDNPDISYGTFKDGRDGKTYKTIVIGTQTWMAENLNYATENGTCYDKDSANCEVFGRYYAWDEALTACPEGWHLPDSTEWNTLRDFVADSLFNGKPDSVGYALKAKEGWRDFYDTTLISLGNGSDVFGFGALPAGYLSRDGFSLSARDYAYFVTATPNDTLEGNAFFRGLAYYRADLESYTSGKEIGRSVRCVKD